MNGTLRLTAGRSAAALVLVGMLQLPTTPARAQLMDQLKGAVGSGQSGGLLGGSGGGLPSVAQASPSNTAGVLQYCMRNNYGTTPTSRKSGVGRRRIVISPRAGTGTSADDRDVSPGHVRSRVG